MKIARLSNTELNHEILEDIDGLEYYPDFLTDKQHQQLLDTLEILDYKIVNGRPTRYFGLPYTHLKKTHDAKPEPIPDFLNLMKPLGISSDQVVIEYYRRDDMHSYMRESELFSEQIFIIAIGSHYKYQFANDTRVLELLMEPSSLLFISGKSRKWKRSIRPRLKEKFNNYIIPRKDFYIITFRNIKK